MGELRDHPRAHVLLQEALPSRPCLPEFLRFAFCGVRRVDRVVRPCDVCVLVIPSHLSAKPGAGPGPRLHPQRCPLTEGERGPGVRTPEGAGLHGSQAWVRLAVCHHSLRGLGQVARLAEQHQPHGVTGREDVRQRQVPGPGPSPAV